ncbi:hypothetical protein B0T14DRAFT_139187 [Immersiella caudata]|uniref:Uncharacterized protein n=1 Tax=Immersiella caudata TaxID=314043 RepID=A0AA40C722_9PEZI|nr:hypothetical protein B0T14DRAFT_139187 [Immersiella caudata]
MIHRRTSPPKRRQTNWCLYLSRPLPLLPFNRLLRLIRSSSVPAKWIPSAPILPFFPAVTLLDTPKPFWGESGTASEPTALKYKTFRSPVKIRSVESFSATRLPIATAFPARTLSDGFRLRRLYPVSRFSFLMLLRPRDKEGGGRIGSDPGGCIEQFSASRPNAAVGGPKYVFRDWGPMFIYYRASDSSRRHQSPNSPQTPLATF